MSHASKTNLSRFVTLAVSGIVLTTGFVGNGSAHTHRIESSTPVSYPSGAIAESSSRHLFARLSSREEVPASNAMGSGKIELDIKPRHHQVCYQLILKGIKSPTKLHLHKGAIGVNGDLALELNPPAGRVSRGCVSAAPDLIRDLRQNPANYYVNVHSTQFPKGAVRGQLGWQSFSSW